MYIYIHMLSYIYIYIYAKLYTLVNKIGERFSCRGRFAFNDYRPT